jgi:hypothetical protein
MPLCEPGKKGCRSEALHFHGLRCQPLFFCHICRKIVDLIGESRPRDNWDFQFAEEEKPSPCGECEVVHAMDVGSHSGIALLCFSPDASSLLDLLHVDFAQRLQVKPDSDVQEC